MSTPFGTRFGLRFGWRLRHGQLSTRTPQPDDGMSWLAWVALVIAVLSFSVLTSTAHAQPAPPNPSPAAAPNEAPPTLSSAQMQALERATQSVVAVRSEAVEGARSAQTLGSLREGSGVVIGNDGVVLTIGYLVLEADKVWIEGADGRQRPARVVAIDLPTGFALLQSLVPLDIPAAALGPLPDSTSAEPLLVASGGDDGRASLAQLLSRRPFSGYWEYHLDEALYTAPARRDHSGAGLFNLRGELVGVGSLILANASAEGQSRVPGNLFVPVELLRPILGELRQRGSSANSRRAWLGVNCQERDGELWVVRVNDDSPAQRAGLAVGDRILSIDGRPVGELSAFWKALWSGAVERDVALQVRRQGTVREVTVRTVDREGTLKKAEGV